MKQTTILIFCFLVSLGNSQAQDKSFTVSINPDTILMGNSFGVTFKLKNLSSLNFNPPEFSDFIMVGGPSQSSNMTMVNGTVSQSASYSYYLEPKAEGQFFIPPAKAVTSDTTFFTKPLEVIVLPNPDGIIQQPKSESIWDNSIFQMPEWPTRRRPEAPAEPEEKPKKKRKVYRL